MKQGWEVKKLGDVCQFENGDRGTNYPSKSHRTVTGIPFINAGHLTSNGLDLESMDYISRERFNLLGSGKVQKDDILFCLRGSLGKFAKVQEFSEGAIASSLVIVRPNQKITSGFLMSYFESQICADMIKDFGNGAAQPNLSAGSLKNFEIPLPPLHEQQRIVAILDEAFAAIAQAKANAEQNLKNAKELFESYLQSVFENKGEGWEEKEFGSVITTLTDYHANGSYEVLKENVELKDTEDYAWMVRSTDFENNFKNSFRYIDKNSYEFLKKSKVFGGEIIMSKIGNAGNVYLMPKSNRPCSLAMNLFLIRIDEKVAIPEFIYQYLKSKKGEIQIKSRLLGMATKTITKDNVRNIVIPFPSLPEQQKIVQKLDALSAETKQLEAIYQQKINDLDELKKSILQKAFAGEFNTTALDV